MEFVCHGPRCFLLLELSSDVVICSKCLCHQIHCIHCTWFIILDSPRRRQRQRSANPNLFGLLMMCTTTVVDSDVEAFVVLVLFSQWMRDTHIICQRILSYFINDLKPSLKPPPWMDPAPYMPGGGSNGNSMSQYQVKKKSGHSNPKQGGEIQPIISYTMNERLARMTFHSASYSLQLCFGWLV